MSELQAHLHTVLNFSEGSVRVVGYEGDKLTLQATNAILATQIRINQQALITRLRSHPLLQTLGRIDIRVRPEPVRPTAAEPLPAVRGPLPASRGLTQENARMLQEAAKHTSDPALRNVLERLSAHARDTRPDSGHDHPQDESPTTR